MNTWFVILSASEESILKCACDRSIGSFAALRMTGRGEFIHEHPLNVALMVVSE